MFSVSGLEAAAAVRPLSWWTSAGSLSERSGEEGQKGVVGVTSGSQPFVLGASNLKGSDSFYVHDPCPPGLRLWLPRFPLAIDLLHVSLKYLFTAADTLTLLIV